MAVPSEKKANILRLSDDIGDEAPPGKKIKLIADEVAEGDLQPDEGGDIPRTDNPFKEFSKSTTNMIELKKATVSLREGLECMNLHYRVINDCNARSVKSFTLATCETKVIAQPIAAGSVFGDGIYILENFLDQEVRALPSDKDERRALELLVKFLSSDHDALLDHLKKNGDTDDEGKKDFSYEGEWTARLSQHLLTKLVDEIPRMDTFKHHREIVPSEQCPCKDKDKLIGELRADTSFGLEEGWSGRTDILMNLPITIQERINCSSGDDDDDGIDDSFSSVSSVEVQGTKKNSRHDRSQILAQTIVFSFLQQKESKLKNYLIPGIGLSSRGVFICFYDSVNDVLLTTEENLMLYQFHETDDPQHSLVVEVVVLLWLTLNYRLFGTGLGEAMKKYKAEFFTRVDDFIDKYKNDVKMPVQIKHEDGDEEDGDEVSVRHKHGLPMYHVIKYSPSVKLEKHAY